MANFIDKAFTQPMVDAIREVLAVGYTVSDELSGGNNLVICNQDGDGELNVHMSQYGRWSMFDVRTGSDIGDVSTSVVSALLPKRLLKG